MVNWTAAAPLAGCVPLQVRRTLRIVGSNLGVGEFGSFSSHFAVIPAKNLHGVILVTTLKGVVLT